MRIASLFAGIGGFDLGITQAIPSSEIVFASEKDKAARTIYQDHFGGEHLYGDITNIEAEQIPDIDMLTGGFPCQAFSLAGERKGFNDTRGTLFFEIARICEAKQPKTLFLENVKGLLSHDNGRTFGRILVVLDELGYDVEWQVLNSKDFGVPQNRERVYIIGHLRGPCGRQVFPISENDSEVDERYREAKNVRCLSAGGHSGGLHSNMTLISHSLYPRSSTFGEGGTGHLTKADGASYCLDCGNMQAVEYNNQIRRLTPIECERLQGFPDNWTHGVSDTARYRCLGNAVTIPLIRSIAERLSDSDQEYESGVYRCRELKKQNCKELKTETMSSWQRLTNDD